MKERKHYLDNLRILCILLLFPYHTCMIYNAFGENFYIRGPKVPLLSNFIVVCSPWFMPLMFTIAGISAAYALQKRSIREFLKERFWKLFVPLVSGLLLYVPAQTYFAERFHNQYQGGYLEQYHLFFTKITDMTGYTGGFTTGHLWFIFYLFFISLLALPLILLSQKYHWTVKTSKIKMYQLVLFFLLIAIVTPLIETGGKSFSQSFVLFLLGFFVLSKEELIERLEAVRWYLSGIALVALALFLVLVEIDRCSGLIFDLYYVLMLWVCILAFLGIGKHNLNFQNGVTRYLAKQSFPIYFFHQSWLIATAYYVFQITDTTAIQVPLIIGISMLLTFLNVELFKRIGVTRLLFGMKR